MKKLRKPSLILTWFFFMLLVVSLIRCSPSGNTMTESVTRLVETFFQSVSESEFIAAQGALSKESGEISIPTTRLGEAIRENLRIKEISNIQGETMMTADVTVETLDLMQIMSRATVQMIWMSEAEPTAKDSESLVQDDQLQKIYDTILDENIETLPKKEELVILTIVQEKDGLKIVLDESLESVLNGTMTETLEQIKLLLNQEEE